MAGRPSKFQDAFVEQAKKLAALGATDREIAEFFEVSEAALYRWRHEYPAFREALKVGKEAADDRVESALYRRAIGYTHDAVKIFQYQGDEVVVPYQEHVAPDTTACIFWLKNRRKSEWRDRQEHEVTGKDGGPVQTEDVSLLTPTERQQRLAALLAGRTQG